MKDATIAQNSRRERSGKNPIGFGLVTALFTMLLQISALTSTAGAQASGTFIQTGFMKVARSQAAGVLLLDGRMLITGGQTVGSNYLPINSAELYDPGSGTFTLTGHMTIARQNHTATVLQNGEVLIAGGEDGSGNIRRQADLYDPSTGKFTATGSMIMPREYHTATLLPDGNVLITGGNISGKTAELYNPSSGTFMATGSMTVRRVSYNATLLQDGTVLIAGGGATANGVPTAEI